MAQYQKDYTAGMSNLNTMAGNINNATSNMASPSDYYAKALEQYGYTPEKLAQKDAAVSSLAGIQQQIANVDLKEAQQLGISEGRKAPMSFIRGEQALIERNANMEKAALAGQASIAQMQLAAIKDDFQMAQQFANTAVQMFTYEQEQKVNAMKWAFTTYSDMFSAMTTQEKGLIDTIYKQEQDKLDAARRDYQFKVNYQLDQERLKLQQQEAGARGPATQGDFYWDATSGTWKSISGGGDKKTVVLSLYSDEILADVNAGKTVNETIKDVLTQMQGAGFELDENEIAQLQQTVQQAFDDKKKNTTMKSPVITKDTKVTIDDFTKFLFTGGSTGETISAK